MSLSTLSYIPIQQANSLTMTTWTSNYFLFFLLWHSNSLQLPCVVLCCIKNINIRSHLWHRASHCYLKISCPQITLLMHVHTRTHTNTPDLPWDYLRPVHATVSLGYLQSWQDNHDTSLFPREVFQVDCIFKQRRTLKGSDDIQIHY